MSRSYFAYLAALMLLFACGKPAGETPVPEPEEQETLYSQGIAALGEDSGEAVESALLASGIELPRAFGPCLHTDELSR